MTAENDKKSLRGYAGLSAMTSDVDAAIAKAESIRRQRKGQAGWPELVLKAKDVIEGFRSFHIVTKLAISVLMFLCAVGFVTNLQSGSPSGTNAPAAARAAEVRANPLPFDTHGLQVELPPTGIHHVLSTSQLRYCQILKVRIATGESIVEMPNDEAVKRFNADVDASNNRCVNYYYRKSDDQIAITDVGHRHAAFVLDAMHDFSAGAAIRFYDLQMSNHKGSKGR
ncbi:MAG: hypothetical protein V4634_21870 [Pseudomonadota bacterium]